MTFNEFVNRLLDEARERGRQWARMSAALLLATSDRQFLEDDARGLLRGIRSTPYDPVVNHEDKLTEEEHVKRLQEIADLEMSLTHAKAALRQREIEASHLRPMAAAPRLPAWMTTGGTTIFSFAFAIGVFDPINDRLQDPFLAALAALVPSVALGIFVCRALTSPQSPENRELGLWAGLGLSGASGILRYGFAPDEPLITIGITCIELFVVLFLDWHGKHLQAAYQAWGQQQTERETAQQRTDVAQQQVNRIVEEINRLKDLDANYRNEIAIRSAVSQKLVELETAAVNAIITGAQVGISENQGLKRGVPLGNHSNLAVRS